MKLSMICVVTIAMASLTSMGQAQVVLPGGTIVGGGMYGAQHSIVRPIGHGPVYPHYTQPHWAQSRHPEFVTPQQFDGYTPWGGINTRNTQIDNTYFTPNRNMSRFNGSSRFVTRPVYDQYGSVTGYQQGEVWNNSATGREHGNLQTYTPNGSGGTNSTATLYSMAGGDIKPMKGK